jgi:hypothetical protein
MTITMVCWHRQGGGYKPALPTFSGDDSEPRNDGVLLDPDYPSLGTTFAAV